MGYTTYYFGTFDLSRQLTPQEIQTIKEKYKNEYFDWYPSEDGKRLLAPHSEKYYEVENDLRGLIDYDLLPIGVHVTGKMGYHGERSDDYGYLEVKDDKVKNVSMIKRLNRIIKKNDLAGLQSLIGRLKKLGIDIDYEKLLHAVLNPDYIVDDNNYKIINYLMDQGEINVFNLGSSWGFSIPTKLEYLKFILAHGGFFDATFDETIKNPATNSEIKNYIKPLIYEDSNLADPNTGITNLMIAAYQGLLDRIGFYLNEIKKQGPGWLFEKFNNKVDKFGNSALHYAAAGNQRDAFFLLKPYIDILLKNKYGKTPLEYIPKRVLWDWACRGQARGAGFGEYILIHVYKFNKDEVIRMSGDKICSTLKEVILKSMAKETLMDPRVFPRDISNLVYRMSHQ